MRRARRSSTGEAMIARARMNFAKRGLPDFIATHIEALGAEASYGGASAGARGGAAAPGRAAHRRAMRWRCSRARSARSAELRAWDDGHLQRPPEADAGGPAVHFLSRQERARPTAHPRSATRRRWRWTCRSTVATSRRRAEQSGLDRRAFRTARRSIFRCPPGLCPLGRQGQCLQHRDHRAPAALRAAAATRGDTGAHCGPTRPSRRRTGRAVRGARPARMNFLIADALGGGGMASHAHRSAGQGLWPDGAGDDHRRAAIMGGRVARRTLSLKFHRSHLQRTLSRMGEGPKQNSLRMRGRALNATLSRMRERAG